MSLRFEAVCVDAADPPTLARWWAELLGWRVGFEDDDGDEVVIEPPAGGPERTPVQSGPGEVLFARVPEAKSFKNRLHFDLRPDDQAAEVARAESLGASRVDIGQGEPTWVVLADPEGNEFCILRAPTP